jgi:type II secretory pathway pseudopilin PulG
MRTRFDLSRGFTLIEVMVILAAASCLAAAGVYTASSVREAASENKLMSDVQTLNNALQMYASSGGTLPVDAEAQDVLDILKLPSATTAAQGKVGLSGSFIDPRTSYDAAGSGDSGKLRAKWDAGSSRFVVKVDDSYPIRSFNLKGTMGNVSRTETAPVLAASDVTSGGAKWVWEYEDTGLLAATTRGNGGAPAISAGMNAALSHGFQGGFWGVGSSGVVTSNYVYDGAGYNGQLGLFSLAGMGADVYDLTTAAGLEAFYREAVRRVLAGGSEGQLMVDVSEGTGSTQTATFTPGDAVAAILIPNGTFGQANFTNDESNLYPLLSLSFPTGDEGSFYASQMVSLGNDGYAFEDLAGGGDQDYEDIIFTANGLEQPEWSTTNSVDPYTYYTEVRPNRYWDTASTDPNMSAFSIQSALQSAGIIE